MVQGHLADMALDVDASALLVYRAAWTKDTGAARVTREAAMAKLHATEAAQRVIDASVQLHGGDGVRSGHVVERLYREIRALRIYEGASDVQRVVIARAVLAEDGTAEGAHERRTRADSDRAPTSTLSRGTGCRRRISGRDLLLDRPEFQYPERLNARVELTDRMVERGFGDHVALIGNGRRRTYKELADWSNRLAHALVENYGVRPGNRVLIRSGNNPALRRRLACRHQGRRGGRQHDADAAGRRARRRSSTRRRSRSRSPTAASPTSSSPAPRTAASCRQVVPFDGTHNHDAELDRVALDKPVRFEAVPTARDDVALLGFTSGTTGEPKATMHFHRDLLAIADGYAREVLAVSRRTTCSSARRRWRSRSALAAWRSSRCASAPPRRCSRTRRRPT